jgi:hypothetical protein
MPAGVNSRSVRAPLSFVLVLTACSGQPGTVATDAGNAPDTGSRQPNVAPDAAESDDASPTSDAAQTDDSSQGISDGLGPDAGPLEASTGDDATTVVDGSPGCSNGVRDLSNIGTGDFSVSFRIATAQTGWVEVVSQRSACTNGNFWDIRLCAPDSQKRCTVSGSILVETSSSGAYAFVDSKIAVNDGSPHDVAVARASGVVKIEVDGKVSGSAPSKASFGSLPAVQTGNGACVGHDSTQLLAGTISDVCISTL